MVCTPAFERAAQLAQGMNASLRIVAFVHQNILDEVNAHQGEPMTAHRSPLWSLQRWLSAEAGLLSKGGLQVCAEVLWCERTVTNICNYIDETEVDYVIKDMEEEVSAQGRTFSTLDWQLLHESRVPVLFVQSNGATTSRKIVAAVDILHHEPEVREMNRSSIEAASQLAHSFGASVHLLSVYDREALPVAEGNDFCPPSLLTYEQARKRFDLLADQYAISAQCRIASLIFWSSVPRITWRQTCCSGARHTRCLAIHPAVFWRSRIVTFTCARLQRSMGTLP
jgi:nucleotide-binding universal stress UspA family protein